MFATLAGALPDPPSRPAQGPVGSGTPSSAVAAAVALQVELGLEPVTDGDLAGDPVATTAKRVGGFVTAGGRGREVGSRRPGPHDPARDLVARWRAAASLTDRAVKQIVAGPYSVGRRIGADLADARRRSLTLDLAETVGAEVRALADVGCPMVQVDEPDAVRIGDSPSEAALFLAAQRRLLDGAGSLHVSLAVTGGNADATEPSTFFDPGFASYLFDLIDGPDNWRLIARAPADRGIVCGVVPGGDRPAVEKEVVVWAAHYAASTMDRGLVRVGLSTSGSLAGVAWEVARARLELLALAAEIAIEPGRRMAERLDPKAFQGAPRAPRIG